MRSFARSLLVLLAAPLSAAAQHLEHSVFFGPVPTGTSTSVQLPKFDGSAGVLRLVDVWIHGLVSGEWSLENTGAQPTEVGGYGSTHYVGAHIATHVPGSSFPLFPNPGFVGMMTSLAAFDGTLDHTGPSGVTVPFVNEQGDGGPIQHAVLMSVSQFAQYVGTGTITVPLGPITRYGPNMLPPGVVDGSKVFASGTVRVIYVYDPLPAPICMGSSPPFCPCEGPSACPCHWPAEGHGCANSASSQGGLLESSGNASLSADTLLLSGTSMPDAFALYVQGDAFVYEQHPFGDGLRCITGPLVRLGARANEGGSSHYPAAGGLPVSVRGGVTAPGTRTYQVFYRDPAEYCTSSTLNATNGMAILWSL